MLCSTETNVKEVAGISLLSSFNTETRGKQNINAGQALAICTFFDPSLNLLLLYILNLVFLAIVLLKNVLDEIKR